MISRLAYDLISIQNVSVQWCCHSDDQHPLDYSHFSGIFHFHRTILSFGNEPEIRHVYCTQLNLEGIHCPLCATRSQFCRSRNWANFVEEVGQQQLCFSSGATYKPMHERLC